MSTLIHTLMPVVVIPLLGYVYSRNKNLPLAEIAKINNTLLLPCLIFYSMVSRQYDAFNDLYLLVATTLVVMVSGVLALVASQLWGVKRDTLMPSMMFNNCGNIGIPLAMGISKELGDVAVLIFIVTNLLFSTLGIMIISRTSSLRKLVSTPVFIATVGGLLVSQLESPALKVVFQTIHMCGSASPFLMLFCLGITMRLLRPDDVKFGVWSGGVVRPLIGLLATATVLALPIPLTADQQRLFLLFALLPPALLNFQMASPASAPRVSGMVFFGTLLSMAYITAALPVVFAHVT
jgi:predicted permease